MIVFYYLKQKCKLVLEENRKKEKDLVSIILWGFSRQVEYWSGLPCPLPGNFPNPGLNPGSPALQVDSLSSESPRKVHIYQNTSKCG